MFQFQATGYILQGANKLLFVFVDRHNVERALEDWQPGKNLMRMLMYVSICDTLENFPIILSKSLHMQSDQNITIVVNALKERQVIYMHQHEQNTIVFETDGTVIDNPEGAVLRAPRNNTDNPEGAALRALRNNTDNPEGAALPAPRIPIINIINAAP